MDLLLAFPQLLLLIALTPVLTDFLTRIGFPAGNVSRVLYLILVIGFFGWPYFGRIIRGQVLSLREREFVDAARSLGAGSAHVIFKQLLPNLWASILVFASLIIPSYIGTEAALSFLGVGVITPTPTWGNMLGDSVNYVFMDKAYLIIPGTALFLVVLFFNLFGDGLRDALDPKTGR
jgi:peptide/nickel transport system permease protein